MAGTFRCPARGRRPPASWPTSSFGGAKSLASFIDEWRIEPQSAYLRTVVEIASGRVPRSARPAHGVLHVLLFRDLLPWPGWNPSAFKKEIGALILHKPMSDRSRETIQRFILHFEGLGDPRLSANRSSGPRCRNEAKDVPDRLASPGEPLCLLQSTCISRARDGSGSRGQPLPTRCRSRMRDRQRREPILSILSCRP